MSRSIPALVKPALLVWGRDRAGLSISDAAAKADISPASLEAWERGSEQPTIPQLRKLAGVYKRPLAVFFLSEPPLDFDAQKEFRRLPGLTPQNESPDLRIALRTALYRREAARSMYEQLGEEIPSLTASIHPEETEDAVCQKVRDLLGISWTDQLSWSGPHAALDAWRTSIEAHGVLVFQASSIDLNEMRGISVPEGPLPLILLNNADAPHARIFSLLHEFVHLLLTNGGHRTSKLQGQRLPEDQYLERISNRFAAAILMPRREFLSLASNFPGAMMGDDQSLNRFAQKIKLSPEAILRRFVSLNKTPALTYRSKRKAWKTKPWYSPPQSAGGPPIEVRIVSNIGRTFTSLVLQSYRRNAVSSANVVDYLGVQLKYLQRVADQLMPKPGSEAAR